MQQRSTRTTRTPAGEHRHVLLQQIKAPNEDGGDSCLRPEPVALLVR